MGATGMLSVGWCVGPHAERLQTNPPFPAAGAWSCGASFGCSCSSHGFWAAGPGHVSASPASAVCRGAGREQEPPRRAQEGAVAGSEWARSRF